MKSINVGIIGVGRIGKLHCNNLMQIPEVNIVAITDPFMDSDWARNRGLKVVSDAEAIFTEGLRNVAAGADAMLVIYLSGHGGAAPVLGKLFNTGKPAVLFFQPFGGHGWMYFQGWRKAGKKVVLLSTSDWSDLDRAVRLRHLARGRETRLIHRDR